MPIDPKQLPELSRLLDEAMALPAGAVDAWLDALPPDRQSLAPALRQMLAARQADPVGGILSRGPRLDAPAEGGFDAHAGDHVGAYRLVRPLGSGGMGEVWLAERSDGRFQRLEALKLPRAAWGHGLARAMERERDIGARLEHPHIARLYDAGADAAGRPFIAMEYIEGRPIDRWCAEQGLDVPARLRLFLQVVHAVAYAHGRLVIHLDLKPANVLVDKLGQTHLLDFGIAKLLADAAPAGPLTREVGRVLTPGYAAPERVAGKPVGVAADIYSLGVMLFELLTGELPSSDPTTAGAVAPADGTPLASRSVRDASARRALRGEVDAILATALRHDPDRRYASADAMADDIERHLRGDTIRARPDTWWYRLRKLVVRERKAVASLALATAALAAGATMALQQLHRAARQGERARAATALVSDILRLNAGAAAQPASGGAGGTARFLDQAAKLIDQRFPDLPDLQAELLARLARIYVDIGAGKVAVELAQRYLASIERLGADDELRARALLLVADADVAGGRIKDAEQATRRAVELTPESSASGLEARAGLARVLVRNGQLDEAARIVAAMEQRAGMARAAPSIGAAKLASTHARLLYIDRHYDEALARSQLAINIATQAEGQGSPFANEQRFVRAWMLRSVGRQALADQQMQEAEAALAAAGDVGRIQAAVLSARYWWIDDVLQMAHYAEQRPKVQAAMAHIASWGDALPPQVLARARLALGSMTLVWGDVEAASADLQEAGPIVSEATESLSDKLDVAAFLGYLWLRLGSHERADVQLRSALDVRSRLVGASRATVSFDWAKVALNMVMRGDAAKAESFLASAPTFETFDLGVASDANSRIVREVRARALLELGDATAALKALPPPFDPTPDDFSVSAEMQGYPLRGEIICAAGRPAEGLPYMLRALEMLAPLQSPNDPGVARLRAAAGHCALAAGQRPLAIRLARLSRAAFTAQPGVAPWFKLPLTRLEHELGRNPGRR